MGLYRLIYWSVATEPVHLADIRKIDIKGSLYRHSELRSQLADFITNPRNRFFSRSMANRYSAAAASKVRGGHSRVLTSPACGTFAIITTAWRMYISESIND